MHQISKAEQLRQVISAEQIQKRVKEIARQISDDYRGQTIHVMALLDNGFMFMADLVRSLEVPVICQFIKPRYQKQPQDGPGEVLEIFFSHTIGASASDSLAPTLPSGTAGKTPMRRSRGLASLKSNQMPPSLAARWVI